MKPLCFIFNEGCGTYKEKKIHAQKWGGSPMEKLEEL